MPKAKRPLFVAITGDVASGKTTACKYLRTLGYHCITVDSITNEMHNNPEIQKEICDLFNLDQYNKRKVREIAFYHPDKRKQLEKILNPRIIPELDKQIDAFKTTPPEKPIVFVEIPLLYECNMESCFDTNILIIATHQDKIKRMKNRGKGIAEIAQRILDAQMPQTQKIARADMVIENNSDLETLYHQLNTVQEKLLSTKKRKLRRISEFD